MVFLIRIFTYLVILTLQMSFAYPSIAFANNDSILNQNFEKYRSNQALLRLFCKDMPKGGDLHHHFAGALFPEYFIRTLMRENLYIHPKTLVVKKQLRFDDVGFIRASKLMENHSFANIRERLLRSYSVRNFIPSAGETKADFFFNTFPKFHLLSELGELEDLLTLKEQAISEHISYIETMFSRPAKPVLAASLLQNFDRQLQQISINNNFNVIEQVLGNLLDSFKKYGIEKIATEHAQHIHQQHEQLALDDNFFTLRYVNYALRTERPSLVFWDLAVAFLSATKSEYIVGVNLVGPEHNFQALQDYTLHMQMCKFLRTRFATVNLSLHAGELTPNLATPKQLSMHINQAVNLAGARRIGHGVDISYEDNAHKLLGQMAKDSIAIEINLTSNNFILSVNGKEHPISLYHYYKVPIVLSTDDPGILRSSLTEEYVKLASLYPQFKYADIKQLVLNSINYSFLPTKRKLAILQKLQRDFQIFEAKYLNP